MRNSEFETEKKIWIPLYPSLLYLLLLKKELILLGPIPKEAFSKVQKHVRHAEYIKNIADTYKYGMRYFQIKMFKV